VENYYYQNFTLGADSIDLPRHRRPLEHIAHGWGQSAGNREHLQGGQGYELKSPYNSTDVATTEESRYFKFSDYNSREIHETPEYQPTGIEKVENYYYSVPKFPTECRFHRPSDWSI
jgi:hypothetical protein